MPGDLGRGGKCLYSVLRATPSLRAASLTLPEHSRSVASIISWRTSSRRRPTGGVNEGVDDGVSEGVDESVKGGIEDGFDEGGMAPGA